MASTSFSRPSQAAQNLYSQSIAHSLIAAGSISAAKIAGASISNAKIGGWLDIRDPELVEMVQEKARAIDIEMISGRGWEKALEMWRALKLAMALHGVDVKQPDFPRKWDWPELDVIQSLIAYEK